MQLPLPPLHQAYVSSFTKALAAEYSGRGVTIQLVEPGAVQTAMLGQLNNTNLSECEQNDHLNPSVTSRV